MKWILIFLIPSVLHGQTVIDSIYRFNEWSILSQFNYSDYQPTDSYKVTGVNPCPWVSFVIHGSTYMVQNIAINLILTRDELDVLIGHKWKVVKDLWNMWTEQPVETFELSQIKGQRFKIHRPGQIFPMEDNYLLLPPEGHVLLGEHQGWFIRLIKSTIPGTGGKTAVAIKRVADIDGQPTYLFSACLLMRQKPI